MRKTLFGAMIASLMLGSGAGALRGQDKAELDQLGQRAAEVNQSAKKSGMMQVALQRVATETGVPLTEVEAMHKHYPDAGPAGVLLACVLADETKKTPEHFLAKRKGGEGWAAMARANKVSIEKLNERMARLERAVSPEAEHERPRAK
jgi:hypothetical protein